WLAEVMPQLCSSERLGDHQYDPYQDRVVETSVIRFDTREIAREMVESVDRPAATAALARWLADRQILPGDAEAPLAKAWAANLARDREAEALNIRAGKVVFPILSGSAKAEWIRERLAGSTCLAEIAEPEAFRQEALAADLIDLIRKENPESIEVLGRELTVEYRERCLARVILSDDLVEARAWTELADEGYVLPSGQPVEVVVRLNYYTTRGSADIPKLKGMVREYLSERLWDEWTQRPEVFLPDPKDEGAEIPKIYFDSNLIWNFA
ncbi:hypothetical protein KKC13_07290, partial [bacterium]|nr:hypothetical protein [bacterium]